MFGERDTSSRTTVFTILAFVARSSSRLMPGFLGIPDVMTAMEDPAVSSYPFVPTTRVLYPHTGPACVISKALPCGMPGTMSTSTTSYAFFSASRCATVPPTFPAPTTVIFGRPIIPPREA